MQEFSKHSGVSVLLLLTVRLECQRAALRKRVDRKSYNYSRWDFTNVKYIFPNSPNFNFLLFPLINGVKANYKKAEVTIQTAAKSTSACSIRPMGMTYRLLNVFVCSCGRAETVYAASRFKLFLCVHLRGVILLNEIFLVFSLCNLIFGEIFEWFIMSSLWMTHSNTQCCGRGQDTVSAEQCGCSSQICWGETDGKFSCQWGKHILKIKLNQAYDKTAWISAYSTGIGLKTFLHWVTSNKSSYFFYLFFVSMEQELPWALWT